MQITRFPSNIKYGKPNKTALNTLKLYLQSLLRCEAEVKKLTYLLRLDRVVLCSLTLHTQKNY